MAHRDTAPHRPPLPPCDSTPPTDNAGTAANARDAPDGADSVGKSRGVFQVPGTGRFRILRGRPRRPAPRPPGQSRGGDARTACPNASRAASRRSVFSTSPQAPSSCSVAAAIRAWAAPPKNASVASRNDRARSAEPSHSRRLAAATPCSSTTATVIASACTRRAPISSQRRASHRAAVSVTVNLDRLPPKLDRARRWSACCLSWHGAQELTSVLRRSGRVPMRLPPIDGSVWHRPCPGSVRRRGRRSAQVPRCSS